MPDLSTSYLGLELKNPLVVASCGLTSSLQGVQNCANAGAGAIVLKSLFEEQINTILEQLKIWMKAHDFKSINDFRGQLSQKRSDDPESYERLQYIKGLTGLE